MRAVILGDTHGHYPTTSRAIDFALEHDIKTIVQVGDWGLFPTNNSKQFMTYTQSKAKHCGVTFYVIRGNHDQTNGGFTKYEREAPRDDDGFCVVTENIRFSPRVHYWTWASRRCLGVGGAASIDRQWRTQNLDYWPDEIITDEDMAKVTNERVDVLFSHDCSDKTPWGFDLIPDWESKFNRTKIDAILDKSTPELQFHGHMHAKYRWDRIAERDGNMVWTYVCGLPHNNNQDALGILDLEEMSFKFASEIW